MTTHNFIWTILIIILTTHSLAQEQNIREDMNQTASHNVCNRFSSCPVLPSDCETRGKEKLYLMAMAPYPVAEGEGPMPSWAAGPEVIPGALLAACHINCNTTVLPNHVIELMIADGGCNLTSKASLSFINTVFSSNKEQKNIAGIIGAGCSESSFRVGSLVAQDKISLLQISPSADSPLFVSGIANYRNTFRVTASARAYVDVFKRIITMYNYQEVAVLYEANRSYMVNVYNHFAETLESIGVSFNKSFGVLPSYLVQPLNELENRARLIFVFAAGGFARSILCIAYHKNMLHPNYQFIFINRRPRDFLTKVTVSRDGHVLYTCDANEMNEALSAATLFEIRVKRNDSATQIISGYNSSEAECQYNEVVKNHKQKLNIMANLSTEFHNAYYDATWALALSLHNANLRGVNLTNYRYGQPRVTQIIRDELLKLSFEGLSGSVQFSNKTQDSSEVTIIDIFQRPVNSTMLELVVWYDLGRTQFYFNPSFNYVYFVNSSTFAQTTTIAHPPNALGYVFITLAVLVGIGIGILHCLNSLWRDLKTIKATSPQLNHLIFSGCYLALSALVVFSLETTVVARKDTPVVYGVLCNAQVWFYSLSVSLVFGTISAKTWRIYRIFNHFSSSPIKLITDTILISFVLCLVIVDCVYLILWNVINPLVMFQSSHPEVFRTICWCDNLGVWVSILVAYKILLMGLVLYLSISTRHVDKPEFKQTKSINTLIYLLVFNIVFGLLPFVMVVISDTTDVLSIIAAYVILSISYLIAAIMCALFVFLPPIIPLLKKRWKS